MSEFLEELAGFIRTKPFHVIRVSEICGDNEPETVNLVSTNYCQNTYSVAKTFTMTALGLLYDKGLLSVDEKVCDILRDELPAGMDERWLGVTVESALLHRAGLPGGFLDIDTTPVSVFGKDFLSYMLTFPLAYNPGDEARYSDGAYYLLSRIAEKKSGMVLDDFLMKEMLWNLGFQEMAWSHCPMGHAMGATGLYINSADAVKLGAVYTGGGVYAGKRYLSAEWVKTAFEKSYGLDSDSEGKIFFKGGMYGQKLMMLPGAGRSVMLQSSDADSNVVMEFVKKLSF